jgi:O-antigen ligase
LASHVQRAGALAHAGAQDRASGLRSPSLALLLVYTLWVILMLDPHRYLASLGLTPAAKVQPVVFAILITVLLFRLPDLLAAPKPWTTCVPLLAFGLAAVASMPAAMHVGFAKGFAQAILFYWIAVVALLMFVRRPRDAVVIIGLFVVQYAWWAVHARGSGLVRWHSWMGNHDEFGAFMAMGVGILFYIGLASGTKWIRWVCWALAAYCVLGVISSYARGAFLTTVLIGAILWFRSPRKGVATAAVVGGGVLVLVLASVLYPETDYWARIMSSFEEGTQSGTGGHRWHLWNAAFNVFLENPLLGAGGFNFGLYVVENFGYESVYGYDSAAKLWNRNVHNIYMQILSELGLVGTLAFLWMTVDFFRWNRRLRAPQFVAAWRNASGGRWDLRSLSYALELGMVAYLAGGFFYGLVMYHWQYSLIAANLMLYGITRRAIEQSRSQGRGSRLRPTRMAPPPALAYGPASIPQVPPHGNP